MAKRDELLATRERLIMQRAEISATIRRTQSDLEDCRATARFFGLQIEFPDDDETRQAVARREHELRMERSRIAHMPPRSFATIEARELPPARIVESHAANEVVGRIEPPAENKIVGTAPPLREFLLSQLLAIGSSGGKAAGLRAIYEQQYGKKIHQKSVGMTLYRLLSQNEVHRDGHVWFYGPGATVGADRGQGGAE